jgi:hypothetical protein
MPVSGDCFDPRAGDGARTTRIALINVTSVKTQILSSGFSRRVGLDTPGPAVVMIA